MKLQRRLSNGRWTDENRIDMFVDEVLERETWFAPRQEREPMTRQDVLDALAAGKVLQYGTDWYTAIRNVEAIPQPKPKPTYERTLECGHTIHHPSHAMMASRGVVCPDCYDEWSD